MLNRQSKISENLQQRLRDSTTNPVLAGYSMEYGARVALWRVESCTNPDKFYYVKMMLDGNPLPEMCISFQFQCMCKAGSARKVCIHALLARRKAGREWRKFFAEFINEALQIQPPPSTDPRLERFRAGLADHQKRRNLHGRT